MKIQTIAVSLIGITLISVILTCSSFDRSVLVLSVALNALFLCLIASYMVSARVRTYAHKLFAVALGAAVLAYTTPAQAAPLKSGGSHTIAKPKIVIFVCYAGVAAAASFVVYSVYLCAKGAGLTGTNTPAPPINGGTNGSSTKVVSNAQAKTGGMVPPGAGSNTNGAQSGPVDVDTIFYPHVTLATNNDASVELKQDISANGWADWQGNPYTWYFTTYTDLNGPHVQCSTNLQTWTDTFYNVRIWISSTVTPDPNLTHFTNMATVIYDQAWTPILTNFCTISTNTPAPVGVRTHGAQMYFRGVKP